VCTPGRMLQFLKRGNVCFDSVRYVVLDEADYLLDMGFKKDIDEMMSNETMVKKVS